ncbi:MAG: lipoyl(octanoyl) transferase LipB [Oligoflexia bacterium]|nr:lipoyl(octanoyl) transferase LipB [Oligoflexia bacterium]
MLLVESLGLIDYPKALEVQEKAVAELISNRNTNLEKLLVCEHPAVITVGRAAGSREEVLTDKLPVYEVSRGGRSTLHLPGQIVVYPILDLEKRGRDLHSLMRLLENAIIETLADFRITAQSIEGKTGVWVIDESVDANSITERKIASLGIAAKKWVSYHGLALNVTCDLKMFSNLSPCGFNSSVMTSMIDEMPEEYKKTWAIEPESLFKNVRLRIIENLKNQLVGEI